MISKKTFLVFSIIFCSFLSFSQESAKGTIWVKTKPTQAEIYIDGVFKGKSPRINTGIAVGEHEVRLVLDGFDDQFRTAIVYANKTTDIVVDMSGKIEIDIITPDTKQKKIYHAWTVGLNLGMYWGNKYTANFYNGSENNLNNISRIVFDPNYARVEIENAINHQYADYVGYEWNFTSGGGHKSGIEIPYEMSYKISTLIGLYGAYNINRTSRIFVQFNYTRLKTNSAFNIHWDDGFITQDNFYQCAIMGEEERYLIDLGFSKEWFVEENISIYTEIAAHINNSRARQNRIQINKLEYSIMNTGYNFYDPNGSLNTQNLNIREGGLGYGAMAGVGLRLYFSEFLSIEPGFEIYYNSINLVGDTDIVNDNANRRINTYRDFKPNYQAFIRLLYIQPWTVTK